MCNCFSLVFATLYKRSSEIKKEKIVENLARKSCTEEVLSCNSSENELKEKK